MSGGITQLVATGAQDAHLVGDPQVSFFRSVYRRYTNFSHVVDRQIIQGNPSAEGVISTVRFERKGDMVGYVYLTSKEAGKSKPFATDWKDISKVELLIGGQVIDTQDSFFNAKLEPKYLGSSVTRVNNQSREDYIYPLNFFFNEHAMCALPLVSLQYHDVELRITWGPLVDRTKQYECWADFIYLDTEERESFASNPQELLIYQVQRAPAAVGGNIMELNFNHPIKFLCASSNLVTETIQTNFQLQVNGIDVGEPRRYTPHFNTVPQFFHAPNLDSSHFSDLGLEPKPGFLIPFCLDCNKFQPTGTLNFSRLDSVRLYTPDGEFATSTDQSRDVYGVNYNVLRIENGMGGLMYAN